MLLDNTLSLFAIIDFYKLHTFLKSCKKTPLNKVTYVLISHAIWTKFDNEVKCNKTFKQFKLVEIS